MRKPGLEICHSEARKITFKSQIHQKPQGRSSPLNGYSSLFKNDTELSFSVHFREIFGTILVLEATFSRVILHADHEFHIFRPGLITKNLIIAGGNVFEGKNARANPVKTVFAPLIKKFLKQQNVRSLASFCSLAARSVLRDPASSSMVRVASRDKRSPPEVAKAQARAWAAPQGTVLR